MNAGHFLSFDLLFVSRDSLRHIALKIKCVAASAMPEGEMYRVGHLMPPGHPRDMRLKLTDER
jgi:hypothetical protein